MSSALSRPAPQAYSEDHADALREVVNMAIGQAADALARRLSLFIELSVPSIHLLSATQAVNTVNTLPGVAERTNVVRKTLNNSLQGEAMILLSHADGEKLAALGKSKDQDSQQFIVETSTLLLDCIINNIAKTLELDLNLAQTPGNGTGAVTSLFAADKQDWRQALLIEANFGIEKHGIRYSCLLFITDQAIETLRSQLDDFL